MHVLLCLPFTSPKHVIVYPFQPVINAVHVSLLLTLVALQQVR